MGTHLPMEVNTWLTLPKYICFYVYLYSLFMLLPHTWLPTYSCMRARSSTLVGSHGLCWEFDQMKTPSCPVKKLGPLITDCSACDSEMPEVDALDSSLVITPNGNSAGQSPPRQLNVPIRDVSRKSSNTHKARQTKQNPSTTLQNRGGLTVDAYVNDASSISNRDKPNFQLLTHNSSSQPPKKNPRTRRQQP